MNVRVIASLIFFGAIGLSGSKGAAESIHGVVSYVQIPSYLGSPIEEVRVRPLVGRFLSSSVPFPIETSLLIRESLSSLRAGDFVVLSGQYLDYDSDGTKDAIYVNGIESVGLKRLIGTWKSKTWDVMRFESFNRLVLFRPSADSRSSLRLQKLKELNYTLAPDKAAQFTILMVETKDPSDQAQPSQRFANPVSVGKLSVENRRLRIEIFDTDSGKTAEVYSLSPL